MSTKWFVLYVLQKGYKDKIYTKKILSTGVIDYDAKSILTAEILIFASQKEL